MSSRPTLLYFFMVKRYVYTFLVKKICSL